MPRLTLLTKIEQQNFDSSPKLNKKQREKFFALNDEFKDYIESLRKQENKVGFLIQLGYFRASGKFFSNDQFRRSDIKFACQILEINVKPDLSITSYLPKDKAAHKKIIVSKLGWKTFGAKTLKELRKELIVCARRQPHPRSLIPVATQYLLNRNIELPQYYVLCDIITEAFNQVEESLINIVDKMLSAYQKDILDDVIRIDNKKSKHHKYSALAKMKKQLVSTKLSSILDSIETFKLTKALYHKFRNFKNEVQLS